MLKADDVAKYFLSKDKDRVLFNNNILEKIIENHMRVI